MELLFNNLDKLLDAPNGIEKARQLILQLAVQGKLTEQDPNDEPASELLKKIKKEKEKLLAEGKIKKQPARRGGKELPPIREEEKPFELPKGWVFTHLENLSATIHYGYTASANDSKTDVRLVRITDIQNDKVNWNTVPGCQIDDKNYNTYSLNNGDLLIARTGGTIGKTYLVENIAVKAVFASYLIRIIPLRNINQYYLKLFTGSQLYWSQLYQKSMGTGQPNVNGTSLKELIISIPPLNEQKRIVEKVNSLISLINELEEKREQKNKKRINLNNSSLEKLLTSKDNKELKTNWKRIEENFSTIYSVPENVTKLKQAILQLAVQGKLVKQDPNDEPASELLKKIKKEKEKLIAEGKIKKPKELPPINENEKPFELPKGWEWVRLGEIGINFDYGTSSKSSVDGEIPVFGMGHIQDGTLIKKKLKGIGKNNKDLPRLFLNDLDILFNRTNSYELVGKSAIFYDDGKKYSFASYLIRFTVLESNVEYINSSLNSTYYRKTQIEPEIIQQCGQANFNGTKLKNTLIPLPSLNEQKRIVEKVNELMSLCNALEEKLEKKEEKAERFVGAVVNGVGNN